MAKADLKKLAETLVNLSVLEVNELGEILEQEHNIKPAAVGVAPAASDGDGVKTEAATAKSEYTVVLKSFGEQKVQVIKTLKALTGIGLGEAKVLVEAAPKTVKESVPQAEAEEMKAKLEEAGATIELT